MTSVSAAGATRVWCKMFARGQESLFDEEGPGRPVVSVTNATTAAAGQPRMCS